MDVEKLKEIQEKITQANTEIARAEGTQSQLLSSIKTEFNVDTIEAAQELLKELEAQQEKSQARLNTLMDDLENAIPV